MDVDRRFFLERQVVQVKGVELGIAERVAFVVIWRFAAFCRAHQQQRVAAAWAVGGLQRLQVTLKGAGGVVARSIRRFTGFVELFLEFGEGVFFVVNQMTVGVAAGAEEPPVNVRVVAHQPVERWVELLEQH
jgi:hypothetical protein